MQKHLNSYKNTIAEFIMLNTIRSKMMAGIFVIIFLILSSSSAFQLYESRVIVLNEMLDKVEHLTIPLKLNMQNNLDQFGVQK